MPVTTVDRRSMAEVVEEALRRATDLVQELDVRSPDELAPPAEQLVDLVRSLERSDIDPYTARHLFAAALEVETSLRARPSAPPASLRLGVETIRQALLRIVEHQETSDDRPLEHVVGWLLRRLHVTPAELAEILDVKPDTVRRWARERRDPALPESDEMRRVRVLAPVVASLSHVLTARGVVSWLLTPHDALKGVPPAKLLGETAAIADLISLASQGRSQIAS